MLEHLTLELGCPETEWQRPVVAEALASAAASQPLRITLSQASDPKRERSAAPSSGAWRDADRAMAGAAAALNDVRDEEGTLIEIDGPVAPALASTAFRKAALERLGARQAFATTTDGRHLRMRDAWRAHPATDAEALLSHATMVPHTLWLVDPSGIQAIVRDGCMIDRTGQQTPLQQAVDPRVDPAQTIFARALLAFLGGLVGALLIALLIANL